jgi:hypothetical protein
MKVVCSKIEIERADGAMLMTKHPADGRMMPVTTTIESMDVVDKWLNAHGWYYAGHSVGQVFTYMPKHGAKPLFFESYEDRYSEDTWEDEPVQYVAQPAKHTQQDAALSWLSNVREYDKSTLPVEQQQALAALREATMLTIAAEHRELSQQQVVAEYRARTYGQGMYA